jgi:hypothetical protein
MKYKRTSAIVVDVLAIGIGGFIKNYFKKRDIFTQDTGEKRRD